MSEIIYFELNNWCPGDDYPAAEPYDSWVQMRKEKSYYINFRDRDWIEKNRIIVVESFVDMSQNFCVTAPKEWVMENCPDLLTKYTKFLRKPDEYGEVEGRFGCPFKEYEEENIGYWFAEEDDEYNYYVLTRDWEDVC